MSLDSVAALLNPSVVDGQYPEVAPWVPEADGVYYDLPAEAYHASERMSASGAKKILRSPAHYRLMRTQPSEPTAAMNLGTAIHTGVLEPETFAGRVVEIPDGRFNRYTKQGKADYAAFQEEHGEKIVLTSDEFMRAKRCIRAIRDHPAASRLLDGAKTEVSLLWQDREYDVPCKARLDALNHGGVIDVKSCLDASPEGFSRAIGTFQYHLQGWHYMAGCEELLDATPTFFCFIAVESEEPHAVAVYQLGRESLMAGARLVSEALARYKAALALGQWEGYPPAIRTINAPRWSLRFDVV